MNTERDLNLQIEIDGQPARSRTHATSVGAYILVIATVIPEHAIDLHSTYTGHQRTKTLTTHLRLARNAYGTIASEHDRSDLPVTHARRHCLFDHLQHLQDLLDELGLTATIAVDDDAIDVIERSRRE
ncbi:MAG: hypothetical protein ACRDK4_03635 [Solirubrobacteraceae bacterium]